MLEFLAQDGTTQTLSTTDEHPFWSMDAEDYVSAGDLQLGDHLIGPEGEIATLIGSRCEEHPEGVAVYNFEVSDVHNYYVRAHGLRAPPLRVHNATGLSCLFGKAPKGKQYARPSEYRKGVRDRAWDTAIEESTGRVRDPQSGRFMSKNKPWDMGHKPGYEFRKHQLSAAERGITREQFLDEHNNPLHYRPELPRSNRSHRGEDLTDLFFGP